MANFEPEMELLKQACRNVVQLQEIARTIESRLTADPEGAKSFIRPCSMLLQKLLEAQAGVEGLLPKLYSASTIGLATNKR